MKLHIVIRTHDGENIHGTRPRYINVSKKELIIGCISSIINSSNLVKNHTINYTILDDHSSSDLLKSLHRIFKKSIHPYKIESLSERGFNHSGYVQFKTCRDSDADLVYSVEDDYLHSENAIDEMLFTYQFLSDRLKNRLKCEKELCIFPFDNPEDYVLQWLESGRVFRTPFRHWKEGYWTTFTMMTTPKVFKDHWHRFKKLSLEYKPFTDFDNLEDLRKNDWVYEGNTIRHIWKNHVTRVNPIPSLAIHVQFEEHRDDLINHLEWWNKYSVIKNFNIKYN